MSDVNCPYCGAENEINHDDGYGYKEDEDFEQECNSCGKEFKFTTSISFDYTISCQDNDHKIESIIREHHGDKYTHSTCNNCDYHKCEKVK